MIFAAIPTKQRRQIACPLSEIKTLRRRCIGLESVSEQREDTYALRTAAVSSLNIVTLNIERTRGMPGLSLLRDDLLHLGSIPEPKEATQGSLAVLVCVG